MYHVSNFCWQFSLLCAKTAMSFLSHANPSVLGIVSLIAPLGKIVKIYWDRLCSKYMYI